MAYTKRRQHYDQRFINEEDCSPDNRATTFICQYRPQRNLSEMMDKKSTGPLFAAMHQVPKIQREIIGKPKALYTRNVASRAFTEMGSTFSVTNNSSYLKLLSKPGTSEGQARGTMTTEPKKSTGSDFYNIQEMSTTQ
jgi:hypothetical protein